jgi:uncharacterized protein with ParB-like and HNH nuclease domain
MTSEIEQGWYEGDDGAIQDVSFKDYQINSTPNDFNVKTIFDFIKSGVVKIPGFQRNYVWDIERASRLIESLLIGLPIPQLFLYEQSRNSFLVIDGQQRLMSIYYFLNGRFPIKSKRVELRHIFAEKGSIPDDILADDHYFTSFNLALGGKDTLRKSRFHDKNYLTLGDFKTSLDLTVIRNVIIRQTAPDEDRDSSIFEIFNRLNTGGINLTPQEIRASLYQSKFLEMIDKITLNPTWRRFLNKPEPDINLKESEILLRSFAMLVKGKEYRESMTDFINDFSKKATTFSDPEVDFASSIFVKFFDSLNAYPREIFSVTDRTRFNISYFEAVFRVLCERAFVNKDVNEIKVPPVECFDSLRKDDDFKNATRFATGQTTNVVTRFNRAKRFLVNAV